MPVTTHKPLYTGPTRSLGQQMRQDVMHVKGHGHGAKLALTGKHRGMGKGHANKARIKKRAQQAFL